MRKGSYIEVSDIEGPRFKVALELLREGRNFTFNDVTFALINSGFISVSTTSDWEMSNLNEAKALRDIDRAISTFNFLKENSADFKVLVAELKPRFSLI